MKFLRVSLGLAIGAIGFLAALVMLAVFFLFFPADDTLVVRLGWAVILALIEGLIVSGTFFAFSKVMGQTRPNNAAG